MQVFAGPTANDVWREAAIAACDDRLALRQASRSGETRELQDVLFAIEDPRQRWISSRLPPMNPAFALAEVVWIVNGRNDSSFLNFWNPALPRFQGDGETYYGAYGWRLRHAFGVDQIGQAYQALRENPETRQVVLQIWDPRRDLPAESGLPRSRDIPCNICSMLKIRDGRLEWTQIMRSNDLIRGFPHNVVQFTYLQELMSAWLHLELGHYTHVSDSLHVYEDQIKDLEVLGEGLAETNTDRWDLGFDDTMRVFGVMALEMDRMRESDSSTIVLEAARRSDLPQQARNMLLIAGSDAARRKGWPDVAREAMVECTDPLLVRLLELWYERKKYQIS
jgi:thymidylate synthase